MRANTSAQTAQFLSLLAHLHEKVNKVQLSLTGEKEKSNGKYQRPISNLFLH